MKRKLAIFGVALVIGAWAVYAALGHSMAAYLSARWGQRILEAGDGKFQDPVVFLQARFFECAWLVTLTAGILAGIVNVGQFSARLPRLWQWVPWSVGGFIGLNLWVKLAAGTCLFWFALWLGKDGSSYLTQYQIKLLVMDETRAPTKVVIAGSSQAHAEIDARLLNRKLGPEVFTTDLHFPGSHGYDFLFLERVLRKHQADVVVCYLSEMNFYGRGLSAGFSLFSGLSEVPRFERLGGKAQWGWRDFGYALLGDMLPVFRFRDPISRRLLGNRMTSLKQEEHDSGLKVNLGERGGEAATGYLAGDQSKFEMAAFEEFVRLCREHHRTVVLCCGQLNPLLGNRIDPALRRDMAEFLNRLALKYDNVRLLQDLPVQAPEDYDDLTHVNHAAQIRFSETIAGELGKIAAERRPVISNQ